MAFVDPTDDATSGIGAKPRFTLVSSPWAKKKFDSALRHKEVGRLYTHSHGISYNKMLSGCILHFL